VPSLTWRSGAHLAVELLGEAPLGTVVVRYDPVSCDPDVAPLTRFIRGAEADSDDVGRRRQLTKGRPSAWMSAAPESVSCCMAAESHHWVFRITDEADDDWASWYAMWLVTLSELLDLFGAKVVRDELTYLLVRLIERTPSAVWLSPGRTTRPAG